MSRIKFKVGDWVIFHDVCNKFDDLDMEQDWSYINGLVGIVKAAEGPMLTVRAVLGGSWPIGATATIDSRHFTRLVRGQDVERE